MEKQKLLSLTPNLMVTDVNATVDFYKNILGFEIIKTAPTAGKLIWAFLSQGDSFIMFQERQSIISEYPAFKDRPIGGALTFFIRVENVDALFEKLQGSVKIINEPHLKPYGKEFAIEDINGFILTFAQVSQ